MIKHNGGIEVYLNNVPEITDAYSDVKYMLYHPNFKIATRKRSKFQLHFVKLFPSPR